jgi:transposase
MDGLFWFTDEQWSRIEPLLPQSTRDLKHVDDLRVLSGIVLVLKPVADGPTRRGENGPKKTLYHRFIRLAERGVVGKDIAYPL